MFQDFLREELFTEIGKNILKYKDLFKNLASRLIFITIFLLSSVFDKKIRKFILENYNYKGSKEKTSRKRREFESK